MFSQEYEVDNKIKVSKVEEVFSEMEMMDIEIADLVIILKRKAVDGYVNYKEFIDETFWFNQFFWRLEIQLPVHSLIQQSFSFSLNWSLFPSLLNACDNGRLF